MVEVETQNQCGTTQIHARISLPHELDFAVVFSEESLERIDGCNITEYAISSFVEKISSMIQADLRAALTGPKTK